MVILYRFDSTEVELSRAERKALPSRCRSRRARSALLSWPHDRLRGRRPLLQPRMPSFGVLGVRVHHRPVQSLSVSFLLCCVFFPFFRAPEPLKKESHDLESHTILPRINLFYYTKWCMVQWCDGPMGRYMVHWNKSPVMSKTDATPWIYLNGLHFDDGSFSRYRSTDEDSPPLNTGQFLLQSTNRPRPRGSDLLLTIHGTGTKFQRKTSGLPRSHRFKNILLRIFEAMRSGKS